MDIRDRAGLKMRADAALDRASWAPGKLIGLYYGASAAVMLVVTVLNFLLQSRIGGTGGLGGLGLRSALLTASEFLSLGVNILMPFWSAGYVFAVMSMVRGEDVGPKTLLEGFRRFGPVLRLNLMQTLIFVGLGFLCYYPAMSLFLMTPLADPLMAILEPVMENISSTTDLSTLLDEAAMEAATQALMPMLALFGVVYAAVALPVFYRFRMAQYALLDDPEAGARMALGRSGVLLKGRKKDLLRLDLSFWWFYALELLLTVVCYGDVLLSLMGVSLPIPAETAYFVFYLLYLAGQVGLYLWKKNHVEATYVCAYESLLSSLQSL